MTDKKQDDLQEQAKRVQQEIADRSREIWLAGLGIFSTIEKEGGKLFRDFVERGEELRKKGKELEKGGTALLNDVQQEVTRKAGDLGDIIEEKFHQTVEALGFTRSHEVEQLNARVDKLNEAVAELSKKLAAIKPGKKK